MILAGIPNLCISVTATFENNLIFENEEHLLRVQKALNEKDIFPRRYFYPSLDTLEYIEPKQECKISREISKKILCLPIYPELEKDAQNKIIQTIKTQR